MACPAFNNDEVVIPVKIKLGVSVEDAHHYAAIGCIETAVPGKWGYRCTGMSFINFARILLASSMAVAMPPPARYSCPSPSHCGKEPLAILTR
ncbi:pyruvate formate lyase family protein [Escherichia coli]